jgi:hypothetical protein
LHFRKLEMTRVHADIASGPAIFGIGELTRAHPTRANFISRVRAGDQFNVIGCNG